MAANPENSDGYQEGLKKNSEHIKPPKWATKLFQYYCRNELGDSILGDMQEQFYRLVGENKVSKAKIRYCLNVIGFINRYTLKKKRKPNYHHNNSTAMFKNYTLITLRNLRKKPIFSFINIFGLAIGLASCMIIFFYIKHESSFDKFHSKANQIYKVTNIYERPGGTLNWMRTPPALAPAIRNNFPGIASVSRLRYTDEHVYAVDDKVFLLDNSFYADSLFLEMFDFKLISGNRSTALDHPNSIVINSELAERFFGDEDPMGKFIRYDNVKSLEVTGVLDKVPSNSHIKFDFLISFTTFEVPPGYLADLNSWGWAGFHTYIQLDQTIDVPSLQSNISALYQANYTRTDTKVITPIVPLSDLYLETSIYTNVGDNIYRGEKSTLYTLGVIALLVLIIAGFNFMNLSTAISMSRSKEIGMRKVMGAVRSKIKTQFLVESMTIACISLIIAVLMMVLIAPVFKGLLNVELPDSLSEILTVLPLFLVATLIIGLLAGAYPSIILSSFNPISAIKGAVKGSPSGSFVKKALTVLQFVISVSLISASLIVVDQMKFMNAKPLGFDKENVLKFRLGREEMNANYEELKNRFLQNPHISNVSRASHAFEGDASAGPARLFGASDEDNHQLNYYQTGYDFAELSGLELIEGRYFSRDFPSDWEQAMILNETAAKSMGLDNPIGQRITFTGRNRVVIGVVRDFNYRSLHTPIAPLAIVMPFASGDQFLVKTDNSPVAQTIAALEAEWNLILSGAPFDVAFMDDDIQRMYEKEEKLSSLVNIFSVLAILLASLGLYGLVSFSAQARLKEIGIRKVLGAKVDNVVLLLSSQFLGLILIANLIAWPLVYFLGKNWLAGFHYQTSIGVMHFIWPMIFLMAMALITLSHQVIKAALTNPVKVLRNE